MITREMFFHTTKYLSKQQIPGALFFTLGGIFVPAIFYLQAVTRKDWLFAVLIHAGCVWGLWSFIITIVAWFKDMFCVRISGGTVVGENLFGKKFEFAIDDILEVRKTKFRNSLVFIAKDNKQYRLCGDIDFKGFIFDYILTKLPIDGTVKIDRESIQRLRQRNAFWVYTRRYPFDTNYPAGYLSWFEPIAEQQKQNLISRGVLSNSVFYGDKYHEKLRT